MTSFGTAMRRSSSILKSFTSSHSELVMVIEQLKEIRNLCKATAAAQASFNNDLTKWAENENRAIQDTVANIGELLAIYADIHTNMADRLKEFRHQFVMVLEGARSVDNAKQKVAEAEEKETRQRRELKKALKKNDANSTEVRDLKTKLEVYSNVKDSVHVELVEVQNEHEAVKMIRLKTGLTKLSRAKQEAAVKTNYIFKAVQDVANLIPELESGSNLQETRYNGAATAVQIISNAKAMLEVPFDRIQEACARGDDPPPYAEVQPPTNPFFQPNSTQNCPGTSPVYPVLDFPSNSLFPSPTGSSGPIPCQTENLSSSIGELPVTHGRAGRLSQLFNLSNGS